MCAWVLNSKLYKMSLLKLSIIIMQNLKCYTGAKKIICQCDEVPEILDSSFLQLKGW